MSSAQLAKLDEIDGIEKVTADCTLNSPTQSLMNLIFDNDMFKEAMASFDIGEHALHYNKYYISESKFLYKRYL